MGTKTIIPIIIPLNINRREKRIPKHGDEGKTCMALIVGETDYP